MRSLPALPVLLLAILPTLAAGCAFEEGAADDDADEAAVTGVDPTLFRQTYPWTGRLILPPASQRRPDGAVRVEIHNAPDPSLRGKVLTLAYSGSADVRARAQSVTVDVTFSDTAKKSMAKGNLHPTRLDGWKKVGPLESLAGAHEEDDVLVALPGASFVGDTVSIERDPVMIAGDFVGLVKFVAPRGSGAWDVQHYDKRTKDFSATKRALAVDAPAIPLGGNGVVASPMASIETSKLNAAGFYAHAVLGSDGRLHVKGLVPRQLRAIPSINARSGASQSLLFTTAGMWDPVADAAKGKQAKGTASSTLLVPNGNAGEAAANAWRTAALRKGAELLVVHTFGAVGPAEDGPLRTGHFAFGVARVVDEPLTGELALDVEYKQVYAHNPNGIVSGSHDYASYSGSFARGWMYGRPIADVALHLPALTRTYDLGGVKIGRPIDALAAELDAMTARYRTGMGTGAAVVTPANSCVQDSSKALYFALQRLDEVRDDARVKAYVTANAGDPAVKDFAALAALADDVVAYMSPLGFTRADWRDQRGASGADVRSCPGAMVGAALCGLASYRTMIPRKASDFYTEKLILSGAGGVVLRTNDVGGDIPGIFPLSPTSPL